MSAIDPVSTAQQLANLYVAGSQTQVDTQSKTAQKRLDALGKLQTALQAFSTAMNALSAKKSLLEKQVTVSSTAVSATASADAMAGSYALFVEQIATAHQMSFDAPASAQVGGTITINQANGSTISVDLSTADTDANGTLSPTEVARAINQAGSNAGKVTVLVVTAADGSSKLLFNAGETGAGGQISVDATAVTDTALRTALQAGQQISAAQDAVVWMGAKDTGVRFQQASNTFTAIQGVNVRLQRAMASGEASAVIDVTQDQGATKANVRSFVDAFNELSKALDELTVSAKASTGAKSGPFASDAGIRSLRSRLNTLLRQEIDGISVNDLGISADRGGKLVLNETRLEKFLATSGDKLSGFFGKTGLTSSSGLLGSLGNYLDSWLRSAGGQIGVRRESVQQLQKNLTKQQTRIDAQYEAAYARYLKQFSALQSLQAQMEQTGSSLLSLPTFAFGTGTN